MLWKWLVDYVKKISDTNWIYFKLDCNDQLMVEHIFMQIKDKKFMLGGPEHWFETVQRFLYQRGYEIRKRDEDT